MRAMRKSTQRLAKLIVGKTWGVNRIALYTQTRSHETNFIGVVFLRNIISVGVMDKNCVVLARKTLHCDRPELRILYGLIDR